MPGFISAVNPSVQVPIGATRLYYICFLNGLAITAAVFVGLNYAFPPRAVRAYVDGPGTAKEAIKEFRDRWDALDAAARGEDIQAKEVETVSELPKDV